MGCKSIEIYKHHDKIGVVCINPLVSNGEKLRITNQLVCENCSHYEERKPKKEAKPKKETKPKKKLNPKKRKE